LFIEHSFASSCWRLDQSYEAVAVATSVAEAIEKLLREAG
jgi:hypothetical protein